MTEPLPPQPADCFGVSPNKEPALIRFLRFILQAYYRPLEIKEPETVILRESYLSDRLDAIEPAIKAKDAIICRTQITLSWADWLRCLFGCALNVERVTYCENPPDICMTECKAFASLE